MVLVVDIPLVELLGTEEEVPSEMVIVMLEVEVVITMWGEFRARVDEVDLDLEVMWHSLEEEVVVKVRQGLVLAVLEEVRVKVSGVAEESPDSLAHPCPGQTWW